MNGTSVHLGSLLRESLVALLPPLSLFLAIVALSAPRLSPMTPVCMWTIVLLAALLMMSVQSLKFPARLRQSAVKVHRSSPRLPSVVRLNNRIFMSSRQTETDGGSTVLDLDIGQRCWLVLYPVSVMAFLNGFIQNKRLQRHLKRKWKETGGLFCTMTRFIPFKRWLTFWRLCVPSAPAQERTKSPWRCT